MSKDKMKGGIIINISDLVIRIMLLFLPGIIATTIIDILTSHRRRQTFHFILHSYLIGIASYGILNLIVYTNNYIANSENRIPTWKVTFLESLLNSKKSINISEVFFASLIGMLLAIMLVAMINRKTIYNVSNLLHISSKHGDGDVWDFLLNSENIEWITIRDTDTKLIYQGAVRAYSEKDNTRELVLSQVQLFKDDGTIVKDLYDLDFVYLSFDINSKIIIEVQQSANIDERG